MSTERNERTVPAWVERIDLPVWIRGSDGAVLYMNQQAGALLGRDPAQCVGRPCHLVVAGYGEDGRPLCGANCRIARLAADGGRVGATDMRVPGPDVSGVHIRVVMIPVESGGGEILVHCAFPQENEHRALEYLRTIVHRNPRAKAQRKPLTRREQQILRMLARDQTLYAIADSLKLSHATVRNHVQHILNKLNVHSIAEAIATYLTSRS